MIKGQNKSNSFLTKARLTSLQYTLTVFSQRPYGEYVSVCSISDHAILVEDSHYFLLRKVTILHLGIYQAYSSSVQWFWVPLSQIHYIEMDINFSLFSINESQHSPPSVYNMGPIAFQIWIHLLLTWHQPPDESCLDSKNSHALCSSNYCKSFQQQSALLPQTKCHKWSKIPKNHTCLALCIASGQLNQVQFKSEFKAWTIRSLYFFNNGSSLFYTALYIFSTMPRI